MRLVPEISRFFGIVVRMFVEPGSPHHRPHFHAYYQGRVAVFAADAVETLGGGLPPRQERLVVAWAEIHQQELLEDWRALQAGGVPAKIEPLR
jgi:hypothetical protein